MNKSKKLCMTGYLTFFLSGLCAISSGIIVSLLQEKYGFSYGITGTLLSCMSIGNMAASFASGLLPGRIGMRNTVLILCSGYFLGYLLMTVSGAVGLLILAFLMVGIAKGCALNSCTVLVGNNSADRTKGMNVMHACYASGALLCPFLAAAMARGSANLPMIAVALTGLVLWGVFFGAGLPGKKGNAGGRKEKVSYGFLRQKKFWILTALLFCQNAAETSVTGWLVTYYKDQGILTGVFGNYTVTIMWGATLIARLLIAFVFPVKDTFKALSVMGAGCTVLYGAMIFAGRPVSAVVLLFAFAFSMAGVNPVAVAGVGREMSQESMGIMLPIGGIGAILMPWVIGKVADGVGLKAGMFCNLVPCAGILILGLCMVRMQKAKGAGA
ncbi:MAG: MFS transporter [Eubacteriales bacterium]|nr:MFS transporter [Eubacteriales bacterium]